MLEIVGSGIIHKCGTTAQQILDQKIVDMDSQNIGAIKFNNIDSKVLRRTSQYTKMLLKTAELSIEDANLNLADLDLQRFGTVINTSYGPLDTNINFAKSVLKKDPDFVSPTLFANTVTNAALGHLCIINGFKGDSTFLMGSNPISYVNQLIKNGNSDYIFVGAVEEFSEQLQEEYTLHYKQFLKVPLSECGAGLIVKRVEENSNEQVKGYIYKSYGCSFEQNPYLEQIDRAAVKKQMAEQFQAIKKDFNEIDLVVKCGVGTQLESIEQELLTENNYTNTINLKENVGEIFGANLLASVVLCLDIMQHNTAIRKVVINHIDISMNFNSIVIGRDKLC